LGGGFTGIRKRIILKERKESILWSSGADEVGREGKWLGKKITSREGGSIQRGGNEMIKFLI